MYKEKNIENNKYQIWLLVCLIFGKVGHNVISYPIFGSQNGPLLCVYVCHILHEFLLLRFIFTLILEMMLMLQVVFLI